MPQYAWFNVCRSVTESLLFEIENVLLCECLSQNWKQAMKNLLIKNWIMTVFSPVACLFWYYTVRISQVRIDSRCWSSSLWECVKWSTFESAWETLLLECPSPIMQAGFSFNLGVSVGSSSVHWLLNPREIAAAKARLQFNIVFLFSLSHFLGL